MTASPRIHHVTATGSVPVAFHHAHLIWNALETKDLTMSGLVKETHLSVPQIRAGLEWVKDVLAGTHGKPITCLRNIYSRTATEQQVIAYERHRVSVMLTQSERFLAGTAEQAAVQWPTHGKFQGIMSAVPRALVDGLAELEHLEAKRVAKTKAPVATTVSSSSGSSTT